MIWANKLQKSATSQSSNSTVSYLSQDFSDQRKFLKDQIWSQDSLQIPKPLHGSRRMHSCSDETFHNEVSCNQGSHKIVHEEWHKIHFRIVILRMIYRLHYQNSRSSITFCHRLKQLIQYQHTHCRVLEGISLCTMGVRVASSTKRLIDTSWNLMTRPFKWLVIR